MILLAKMHACACSEFVRYVWDEEKAAANLKKHHVDLPMQSVCLMMNLHCGGKIQIPKAKNDSLR
jgi:hypothetical protein